MRTPGQRIGAILSATDDTVKLLGFGVYAGDFVPPKHVGGFNAGMPNPRLDLDNGETVWGCECWWGPEKKIKEIVAQYQNVEDVRISRGVNIGASVHKATVTPEQGDNGA